MLIFKITLTFGEQCDIHLFDISQEASYKRATSSNGIEETSNLHVPGVSAKYVPAVLYCRVKATFLSTKLQLFQRTENGFPCVLASCLYAVLKEPESKIPRKPCNASCVVFKSARSERLAL